MNWSSFITYSVLFFFTGSEPHLYGQQRMFGALGWGLVSILAGWTVDLFSDDSFDKNYKPLFYFASILLSADLIAATFITVCIVQLKIIKLYRFQLIYPVIESKFRLFTGECNLGNYIDIQRRTSIVFWTQNHYFRFLVLCYWLIFGHRVEFLVLVRSPFVTNQIR